MHHLQHVDQTFVLREFMLFFMTLFFAWALLLIPCFHWKERIVVSCGYYECLLLIAMIM